MGAAISDELLKRRARYGGRNVTGLAILATILAAFSLLAISFAKTADGIWFLLPLPFMALAYWLVAIAARRGSPLALNFVLGVLAVQFLVSIVGQVAAYVVTGRSLSSQLFLTIIPLLVIAVLARNRTDLIELRRRGLWDELYGAAKPSRNLCLIGGALLVVSTFALYGGLLFAAIHAAENGRLRKEFSTMVLQDEKALLTAIQAADATRIKQVLPDLQAKANDLESKAQGIVSRSAAGTPIHSAATTYVNAVQKWREGFALIGDEAQQERMQKLFLEGDELRKQAVAQFDASAAKKQ
jgi:hypothetical protein